MILTGLFQWKGELLVLVQKAMFIYLTLLYKCMANSKTHGCNVVVTYKRVGVTIVPQAMRLENHSTYTLLLSNTEM